jgi:hypothetical protein
LPFFRENGNKNLARKHRKKEVGTYQRGRSPRRKRRRKKKKIKKSKKKNI